MRALEAVVTLKIEGGISMAQTIACPADLSPRDFRVPFDQGLVEDQRLDGSFGHDEHKKTQGVAFHSFEFFKAAIAIFHYVPRICRRVSFAAPFGFSSAAKARATTRRFDRAPFVLDLVPRSLRSRSFSSICDSGELPQCARGSGSGAF